MAPWSAGLPWRSHRRGRHRSQSSPPATAKQDQPDVFEVTIDRSARAHAAFGLRLVGAQEQSFQVLMRDVPAGAVLSHGERRDASTWTVKPSDLEHLHLALDDGTPDAFDLRIDVARLERRHGGQQRRPRAPRSAPATGETPVPALGATAGRGGFRDGPRCAPDMQQQKAPAATPSRNRVRDDKGKTATVSASSRRRSSATGPEGASGSAPSRSRRSARSGGSCRSRPGRPSRAPSSTSPDVSKHCCRSTRPCGPLRRALAWRGDLSHCPEDASAAPMVATARRSQRRSQT